MISKPNVAIIILNFNGWHDTIECLETIFRLSYPNYDVMVVDNDSRDGSLGHIQRWAAEETKTCRCENPDLQYLFDAPLQKPLSCSLIDCCNISGESPNSVLTLMQTGKNLGYAGGNNVGIRYALEQGKYDYIWLVNNDTVVDCSALDALVDYCLMHPEAGIVGSRLMYYHEPQIIQSLGGKINSWFATTSQIGTAQRDPGQRGELEIDYVSGASFFLTKRCIEKIGLMPEEYFLYMEDCDYSYHARLGGFRIATAYSSTVFHKEGSSTGCRPEKGKEGKSYFMDTLSLRNRLLFARKYLRPYLPTVEIGLFISMLIRIKRCQWKHAVYALRLILGIGV